MKVIVGLGNPGERYENTRHNVGFLVLEALKNKMANNQISSTKQVEDLNFKFQKRFSAEVYRIDEWLLVKPQTYMNDSGRAVRAVLDYYKVSITDLWVVHDDLDIVMGEYKIQLGKGPKIHGGVNSIEETLGKEEFWRVRIGVDSRTTEQRQQMEGRDYVLMKLAGEEKRVLEKVVDGVADEVLGRLGASV